MTGEQFLNSLRYLDMEITALDTSRVRMEGRRQDLLDKAESFGAGLTGNRVQHALSSKTEDIAVQLADLISVEELARKMENYQQMINQRIDMLVDLKRQATDLINRLPDTRHRAVLTYRYLDNLKWSTIADLMGYAQNWVEGRLKTQAIEAFEGLYKNSQVKTSII